jgi:YD repeat-containing protein
MTSTKCESTPWFDKNRDKPLTCSPSYGNPIYPLLGNRQQRESLLTWLEGPSVELVYDSRPKLPSNSPSVPYRPDAGPGSAGLWQLSVSRKLALQRSGAGELRAIQAHRGGGAWLSFLIDGVNDFAADADISDRLYKAGDQWRYLDASRRALETYDSHGVLLTIHESDGRSYNYLYSDANTPIDVAPGAGYLIKIQDTHGRGISMVYDVEGRFTHINDALQRPIVLNYGAEGNLERLNWQDGSFRQYLYENSDLTWALTGLVSEDGGRYSTYAYDAQGRGVATELAGGTSRYSVTYSVPPTRTAIEIFDPSTRRLWREFAWQAPSGTVVVGPEGTSISLGASLVQGVPRLSVRSQPAGSGCAASSKSISYDANGNVAREDDFNGSRTCRVHDLSRNLESSRVEGLSSTAVCSTVLASGASLPAGSRKTSSQWHPDWRLSVKTAEPGRLVTSVYNGQPDPSTAALWRPAPPVRPCCPTASPSSCCASRSNRPSPMPMGR